MRHLYHLPRKFLHRPSCGTGFRDLRYRSRGKIGGFDRRIFRDNCYRFLFADIPGCRTGLVPVEDHMDLFRFKPELRGYFPDPCNSPEPPRPGVAYDQEQVRPPDGPPADVLHAGLGVDREESVLAFELLHTFREKIVCKTITAGALGPAHCDEIESL